MNVLYTFDTRFWRMAAVAINSLMTSQKNADITVYCMVAPHTCGKRLISKIVRANGGRLVWKQISKRKNPYRGYDYSRWSPVIFYRLFAHRVFPDVDKMLYMDCDTLVRGDLGKMYNTDLSGYVMGAIRDMAPIPEFPTRSDVAHVKYVLDKHLKHGLYVNSGVLLLDLRQMAAHDADLQNVKIKLRYPDQDILNVALDGKILELPLRYNCIPEMPISRKFKKTAVYDAQKNLTIAHFYAVKPYYYYRSPRAVYSMFTRAAAEIKMYPDDFIKLETQKTMLRHRRSVATHIPHLRIDRRGRVRLFGIRIL